MVLPIYSHGNSVLKKDGEEVKNDHEGLEELIDNMFDTMAAAGGIGLAAHQVGIPIRLFVVDIAHYAEADENLKDFRKVFINSEVIEEGEDMDVFEEGCLSFPGLHFSINRPTRVKMRYQDENFDTHEEWLGKLAARVVLHEHDHTRGVVFSDKLAPLKRKMIKSKLDKIKRGDFVSSFKVKIAGKDGKRRN